MNVLHGSTQIDGFNNLSKDTIRYLSFHDNSYIRYFKGHSKKVTSLEMSPVNDLFMSASLDNTIKLWDLRIPSCTVLILNKRELYKYPPNLIKKVCLVFLLIHLVWYLQFVTIQDL